MPRKPVRRSYLLKSKPVTFSPFARSIARLVVANMAKSCQMLDLSSKTKSHFHSPDSGPVKHPVDEMSDQSESSEEEVSEGVVQADFAFFDPKPGDFHGVKVLLQTYLDDMEWDLSGFVDLILGQTTVGTVVKIEDDEDNGLFSVVSVLNLGRYKDNKCITQVKEFLLKACGQQRLMDDVKLLLEKKAQTVGLLVSQHVTNLPPQLLPPLYDALFDEVLWATEDEPTKELQKSFHFKSYLLISRIYKHKNAHKKNGQGSDTEEAIIYIKPEDEIFYKLSTWSFSFPLNRQQPAIHGLKNYQSMGLVMAVEADKVSTFRQELQSLISEL